MSRLRWETFPDGVRTAKLIIAGAALLLTAAAPAPAPTYDWKLTPTGWGPAP